MTNLIIKLLQRAAIATVDNEDLHLQLLSHVDYPSLKAITDTLDYFGIENVAANVPKDALTQMPKSFLALIDRGGVNQLVFTSHDKANVIFRDENNKKTKMSVASFKEVWTGTIIAIEVPEKEKGRFMPKASISKIIAFILFATILGTTLMKGIDLMFSIYFLLALVGLGISYLILKESQGDSSALTVKVCNTISANTQGCSAVINNARGKLSKHIGLGDLSLIYFASTVVICMYLGVNTNALLIVASLTLPVVVYTLYSQAFKIKDWCFLCLGIAAVLVSQFVILLNMFATWDFSFSYLLLAISITVLVSGSWILFKPYLAKSKELEEVQKGFLSLKRDEVVFEALLEKNRVDNLATVSDEAMIHFGNIKASLQITAYTNPLCGFCTEAFQGYDALLTQFKDNIGISFIFNTPQDTENPSFKISKRIIELYNSSPEKAWKAMKDWFAIKEIDVWTEQYGTQSSMLLLSENILENHRSIVMENQIFYTPETIIGEFKFPRPQYAYKDLGLFMNYFKEKQTPASYMEVS